MIRLMIYSVIWCSTGIASFDSDDQQKPFEARALKSLQKLKHEIKRDKTGHIWMLDLSEQDAVHDDTLAVVRDLPYLRELYLIYIPIKGRGLIHLRHLKRLEKLDLYGASLLTDRGMCHVSCLTKLKCLDITGSKITDAGIESICRLKNLETLRIGATKITDNGMRHLYDLKKLKLIDLGSTNVTENGIKLLAAELPSLDIER